MEMKLQEGQRHHRCPMVRHPEAILQVHHRESLFLRSTSFLISFQKDYLRQTIELECNR